MKITGFVGSPRVKGNSAFLVGQILDAASAAGAETRLHHLPKLRISGCMACMHCQTPGKSGCAIQDDMQGLYKDILESDAIVIGTPIYMFNVTGQTKTFIDRFGPFVDFATLSPKVKKISALVVTQGTPDTNMFKGNLEWLHAVLRTGGFPVCETIIEGGALAPDAVAGRKEAIERARQLGARLPAIARG